MISADFASKLQCFPSKIHTCNSFMSIYVSVHAQSRSILNSEALSRSCDLVFIKLSPQSFSAFPLVRRIVQAQSQEYGIVYCTFILV